MATIVIVSAFTLGVTSYENHAAARIATFNRLKTDARELEVRLHAVAEDVAKDARFMASLPPIQGVIRARSDKEGKEDSEQVWQTRLQTIYQGLLEANPNYLSASYLGAIEKSAKEIVRVERFSSGSFVRVLPQSRLSLLELSGLLLHTLEMKPGDVLLDEVPLKMEHEDEHKDNLGELVLTATIPIYDDIGGDVVGLVAIETDLEEQIKNLLVTTIESGQAVYVISGEGRIVLQYSRKQDFQQQNIGKPIGEVVEGTTSFFSPDSPAHRLKISDESYATWVVLDQRHTSAQIGFLLVTE
ncbi:MAG: hypothetical protein N2C12_02010 [Planctomycetales bacterium]